MLGAARGRSTPPAGVEIVYAGLRERLDELTLPALVVWGGRDQVVSPRYAEPLRDALPDGRLLLLPEAGHVPMCEQPAEVAAAVLALLQPAGPQS
jgi:pimeloyl-ACP methyl ester carboxylesterase